MDIDFFAQCLSVMFGVVKLSVKLSAKLCQDTKLLLSIANLCVLCI